MNKQLEKLIGCLPSNWEKMTLEQKIWQVERKWRLLSTDDMYDLEISWTSEYNRKNSVGACFSIEPNADHQFTYEGSCFAIPEPAEDGQVDIGKFPEYLRPFIEDRAWEDWDTDKKFTCLLNSYIETDTFEEAAEKMYFFLDLLTCGYEMTEVEWYKEEHPNLFTGHESGDHEE